MKPKKALRKMIENSPSNDRVIIELDGHLLLDVPVYALRAQAKLEAAENGKAFRIFPTEGLMPTGGGKLQIWYKVR